MKNITMVVAKKKQRRIIGVIKKKLRKEKEKGTAN